jgi:hypothetical protein
MSALFTWRSAVSSPESGLTPTEHQVALTLSLHMNELGESCFPSIDPTLHEETCGRSAATIRDAINQLVELGWLHRQARVGRGRSNEYEALIPAWYETHRREADFEAPVALRRAAAIAAATAAHTAARGTSETPPAATENRLTEAGNSQVAHRSGSGNPPESVAKTTGDRRRGRQEGVNESDSSRTTSDSSVSEGRVEREDPAAAEPARDVEVRELVLGLPGADGDSPARIIPIAHGLPRRVFLEAVETVRARRAANPCGLLTHLLRIAAAERAAVISAQLAREIVGGARSYVPAPWSIDVLRREDPYRYTAIIAKTLADEGALRELFRDRDDLDAIVAHWQAARNGVVAAEPIGTPTVERRRWVERNARDRGFPLAEIEAVIQGWDDVDDVERQELHDLARQLRTVADREAEAA